MTGYVWAVPGAETAPGTAFARAQGSRKGWLVAASVKEVLSAAQEAAAQSTSLAILSPWSKDPISCNDLKAEAKAERAEHRAVVVDVSGFGPEGCPAVRLGAHLSILALSDALTAAAVSKDISRALPGIAAWLDEHANTNEADLASGLKGLGQAAVLWHEASDAAQVVASYLRCHPRVAEVRYPGLKQDPSFAIAARTLQQGFGPHVSYRLRDVSSWKELRCDASDPREQVLRLERLLDESID